MIHDGGMRKVEERDAAHAPSGAGAAPRASGQTGRTKRNIDTSDLSWDVWWVLVLQRLRAKF